MTCHEFFFLNKTQGLINTLLTMYKSSSLDNFSSHNMHLLSFFTENRPKSPFSVKIDKKCLLPELKLPDYDDLYLVRSVLMRPCVLFKKNRDESLPSPGGQNTPKMTLKRLRCNCAMCWGRRVSFLIFFFD